MKPYKPGSQGAQVKRAAAADLQYYGGRVISNVQVVPVLWGPNTDPAIISQMQNFYQIATNSSYWSWLTEYNTAGATVVGGGTGTNQIIGNGSVQAPITITPSFTGNTIDDENVKAELSAQIAAGKLPAPTADASGNTNTYYPVFFPSGDVETMGGSQSCQSWCAYHGTVAASGMIPEFYYAVQPDFGPGTNCDLVCSADPMEINNVTSVASHELTEATTDAEVGLAQVIGPPLAWYDTSGGEIGDICAWQLAVIPGTTVTAQKEWSNQAGDCIIGKGGAGPTGTVAGAVTGGGNPIVAASITMTGPSTLTTSTDGTGHYSLMLPPGTYSEAVSANGWITQTIPNVVITQDMTTTVNVTLVQAMLGYVAGTVTDANDKLPLSGAQVQALQGTTVVGSATTDKDGKYKVQLPTGDYTVTASLKNYATGSAKDTVAQGQTVTQDFALGTAVAAVSPSSLSFIMGPDQTRTRVLTLSNSGTADLTWQLKESGGGIVASPVSIPKTSHLRRNPLADPNARTAASLFLNGKAHGWTHNTAPGTVLGSFPAPTLGIPFGAGFDNTVWLSDAIGVLNQEYSTSGTPARQYPASWAGVWPGDMALDTTHGLMCQVNVGGDNGIYCWDEASGTVGGSITGSLPWTGTSQRGLAYRADDDSFYIGGWNEGIIYHVKGLNAADKGTVISKCSPADGGISGLAYNSAANVLWEATNSATDTIYELNPDTCAVLSSMPHPSPGNHGGGIELDSSGNLWTISQSPPTAYLLESDVPLYNDVPWLDENPTSGTLAGGKSVQIGVVANTFGMTPGVYAASIFIVDNAGRQQQLRVPVSLIITAYRQGVNAGGSGYTDSNGDLWSADQMLSSTNGWGYLQKSTAGSTKAVIANTPDPQLFQTQRIDPYGYKFTGLPNGVYQVELGFAEFGANHKIDKRVFDVVSNDTEILTAVDISFEAGNQAADWHSFNVSVSDGDLDVRLLPTGGSKEPPVINALRVTLRPDLK